MNIISRFLKKNGIKDFTPDYLTVIADNDEYVLSGEQFFVHENDSLWTTPEEALGFVEFSLIQAHKWEDFGNEIVNKVFRICADQLKIEETRTFEDRRAVNILEGTRLIFSIKGEE